MKNFTLFLLAFFLGVAVLSAQTPHSFRYQAVARDNSGVVLANQSVSFRINILSGSISGTVVYSETHTSLSTNAFGLVELEIGKGTFSDINWGSNSYFVKIEMDPAGGTDYQTLSTSQLLSVPYALYAKTVETGDNWGSQAVVRDATLGGNGTTATPLKIAQQSATSGQVLKWNGATWAPDNDQNGDLNLPFSGTANTSEAGFSVTNSSTTELSSGIYGYSTSTTNRTYGIAGRTLSSTGVGAYGSALATAGINYGVLGFSQSTSGLGVFGGANSATGHNYGVFGQTSSNEGTGVYGNAIATTGVTYGVLGKSYSTSGKGVYGIADASSGFTHGVYGLSSSVQGIGIYGTSPNFGVMGVSTSNTGEGVAVRGEVYSPTGYSGYFTGGKFSVYGNVGINTATPASALEVTGQVKITGGTPGAGKVLTSDAGGLASWQSASLSLPFEGSVFADGVALSVHNTSLNEGAAAIGILGSTSNTGGIGVKGYARATSGTASAVAGDTDSPTGYSGYFEGGRFYVQGNVGIGTNNPASKLDINGQVKITGGTPGVGKVLTSDATGLATWQTPPGLVLPFTGYGTNPVLFEVYQSSVGIAVIGENSVSSGLSVGVYGRSKAVDGYGVEGLSEEGTGVLGTGNQGVVGSSYSSTGKGVHGVTTATSGFSGYFEGGKFFVEGNVGIGNSVPAYKLDVTGNRIRLKDGTKWIAMRTDGSAGIVDFSYSGQIAIQGTLVSDNILLNPALASKVGIRTWVPMYDLDVTGNIRATGSVYYGGSAGTANGTAYTKPDFVFGQDYEVMNTGEVEDFLRKEKHLPWITSAEQEKRENGDVTDMTRMAFETLEAIENIQLQLIEQQNLVKELKAENSRLKTENDKLIENYSQLNNRLEQMEQLVAPAAIINKEP